MISEEFRNNLRILGFRDCNGIMVRFSNPRIGVKPDGTLIIGYHEHPEKVYDIDTLLRIIGQ